MTPGWLTPDLVVRMEAMLTIGPRHARQSGISWLREPPGAPGPTATRQVGVPASVLEAVPAHRIRRMAQEGQRLTAQNFTRDASRPPTRHPGGLPARY